MINKLILLLEVIMNKDKQTIKCDVYDCKHCDCDEEACKLNEIKVCNCRDDETKEATMCDSFKKRQD